MRFAPTVREMGTIAHRCAVGRPARSSSLASVAPQRVHVPQVDVRMTACTPVSISARAMSRPNFRARATDVAFPTVTQ